jgi:CDP-glucose 4,6-dehydratase
MSFWKGRRVFVSGCTGFLGTALSRALVARHASVVGLVRDVVPTAPFFTDGTVSSIATVRGDLLDFPLLERVIGEYEIDTVFHLGAQAIVGVANRNPLGTFETNIRGTWNLLEACRRTTGVSRIVVASSDKAYGIQEKLPYTEAAPLQGTHPYDVSKSCADLIALTYFHSYALPVCVTRCGNLFGGGDLNFSRLIPGTIRSALGGERPLIRSDGTMVRDYIHVEDAVAAYLLLAERMDDSAVHGKAFNFSIGNPLSILEVTRLILDAAKRPDLEPVILATAKAEIPRQYLSSEFARSRLGWRPSSTVEARLGETIDWYRSYLARVAS